LAAAASRWCPYRCRAASPRVLPVGCYPAAHRGGHAGRTAVAAQVAMTPASVFALLRRHRNGLAYPAHFAFMFLTLPTRFARAGLPTSTSRSCRFAPSLRHRRFHHRSRQTVHYLMLRKLPLGPQPRCAAAHDWPCVHIPRVRLSPNAGCGRCGPQSGTAVLNERKSHRVKARSSATAASPAADVHEPQGHKSTLQGLNALPPALR